jgi:putative two-component system response regulator
MARPERILVADDDEGVRDLLRTLLGRAGYDVVEAADGGAALAGIATHGPIDLLLLDVRMPVRDGIDVTRRVRANAATELMPIILITGLGALEDKVAGLDAGATDLLTKPFEAPELLARIRAALRTKAATDRLESTQGVLIALANAVEAKDSTTGHHCDRLAALAIGLAHLVGLDDETTEAIGYGAALHDVGKIGISETILRKSGPLTDQEWMEMREHPAIGARIVQPLRLGELVGPIVHAHHERWDGAGYPSRLSGTSIPIGARIVTIVDSFDAMTNDRPYRKALSIDRAMDEFRREAGGQFDPVLAELFVAQRPTVAGLRAESAGPSFTRGLYAPAGVD